MRRSSLALVWLALAGCTREVVLAEGPAEDAAPRVTRSDVSVTCTQLCEAAGDCAPWRGFCETECEAVLVSGCEAEADDLLACLSESDACEVDGADCDVAFDALVACASPDHCDASACIIEPGTCSCAGLCGGELLVQECVADADGGATCICLAGEEIVRTCDAGTVGCTFASCCEGYPL